MTPAEQIKPIAITYTGPGWYVISNPKNATRGNSYYANVRSLRHVTDEADLKRAMEACVSAYRPPFDWTGFICTRAEASNGNPED